MAPLSSPSSSVSPLGLPSSPTEDLLGLIRRLEAKLAMGRGVPLRVRVLLGAELAAARAHLAALRSARKRRWNRIRR